MLLLFFDRVRLVAHRKADKVAVFQGTIEPSAALATNRKREECARYRGSKGFLLWVFDSDAIGTKSVNCLFRPTDMQLFAGVITTVAIDLAKQGLSAMD